MTKKNFSSEKPFPVVGIGGSAGAFSAIREIAEGLPSHTGMAYVYMQHQSPDFDSQMVSLLANRAKLPVLEADEGMFIEPDFLYIVPPGKELLFADGCFNVSPRVTEGYDYLPINRFFFSLAENLKEFAIGVVLSGANEDGALGLKAIKAAGGLCFAQNETAQFQSMPRAAVEQGVVDLVLSPQEIVAELKTLATEQTSYFDALLDPNGANIADDDPDLLSILQIVQKATSVDFSQYKMSTIKRRIIRRMLIHKIGTLKEYVHLLRAHTPEAHHLFNDLLINVTQFFRDPDAIEYLKIKLLPEIVQSKKQNEPIRIWVPACSTGQEVYTLAMLLIEIMGEQFMHLPIQIFATDLSETVISKARLGVYSKEEVTEVSPKRLQRFFVKIDGGYRITKAIRDLCVFAKQNIAKDPPFSKLDLISCCNFLIYVDNPLQKKIFSIFHYALNPGGYLILGKSETVGSSAFLFTQADKKVKVFAKKQDSTAKLPLTVNYAPSEGTKASDARRQAITQKNRGDENDLEKAVDSLLLQKFAPASVVIDREMEIVQFRGATGIFLEPTPGKASLNLLKMAKPGLSFELRNAVHKAIKLGEAVKKTGLEVRRYDTDKALHIDIEVIPIKSDLDDKFYLVAFYESVLLQDIALSDLKDSRVQQLETELISLREDMRSIVESKEAMVEELQSANEEIVSSNEELQSINEELETSKEEVESSNEELITINQELQLRNEQLLETQDYAEAVFSTIREALVILDRNLRVKTANAMFYKTFHLREEHTEGRFFYELNNRQWDIPKLRELLEEELAINPYIYGYELSHNFPGIGEKALVVNVRRIVQKMHGEQLILLALEDITEHRRAQQIIAGREVWFRNLADNAPVMIWVTDKDKQGTFFNKAWLDFRDDTLEEGIRKGWMDGVHPDDMAKMQKMFDDNFAEKLPFELKYRVLHHGTNYVWLHNKAKPNFSPEGQFLGYIGSCVVIEEVVKEKNG